MKKVLCLLLCTVMLLGVLVACGGDDPDTPGDATTTVAPSGNDPAANNPGGTTSQNPGNTTTATQPAATIYPKHTPVDFGDGMGDARVFTFLARNNRWKYLHGDENSTAAVTQAAYKRNLILEEMYNIDINVVNAAGGTNAKEEASFRQLLSAASGEYDIAIPDVWWGLEYAGYFENIMRIPEIDLNDEYWVKGWNDNMIINNRMYTIVGDAALEILENIEVVFYNRSIEEEYDYNLYQTVIDGEWTIDEMISTIEVFEDALNNNDTSDDVYGVIYNVHSLRSSFYSAGINMLKTNRNNGVITVVANNSRYVNIADKLTELFHHTSTKYESATARGVKLDLFVQSKSFMFAGCLYRGTELKAANTTFDYGILLCPKYEVEDDYRSTSYGLSTWGICSTASDINMVAVILDTMTWLSNTEDPAGMGEERLVYTYFETVLKGQVAESPEDVTMLDMSRELAYYDFGFIICYDVMLLNTFQAAAINDYSVSTVMDSMISVAETGLTDVVDFYNNYRG